MATAALAQSSYKIAKSWQYQEQLPKVSLEDESYKHNNKKYSQPYNNIQGNQIQPDFWELFTDYVMCFVGVSLLNTFIEVHNK